ncbi:MAG: exo-alpha-sialidase [Candidatus Omnitrophica bacterium]|nr:exo-alpha-sialidase [Candidatus Omnitrophota bacterium]
MRKLLSGLFMACLFAFQASAAEPLHEAEFIFDPAVKSHGHVHASCIVECPNGDLRAVWYENGDPLPPPYFSAQQDKNDNVRIGGSRRGKDSGAWEEPFVMADTFGVSDNNPCLVIDKQERLWLIYPTLTGVPKWTWGSALIRYQVSSDYQKPGKPAWEESEILIPRVKGLGQVLENTLKAVEEQGLIPKARIEEMRRESAEELKNPLIERFGFMPRAHPLVRSDGALLLPLSNENFSVAAMAITSDGGATWSFSKPVPEAGLTQPTVVEFPDGKLSSFFRNSRPQHRILRSDSEDGGLTWSAPALTDLLHPGAGIEALVLKNGHLVMIYNDKEEGPRDRLAVSISEDRGKTWKWTRHLENTPGGRFDYPSIIQAKDGSLHATYSYNLETIKHVRFNEEWVKTGE